TPPGATGPDRSRARGSRERPAPPPAGEPEINSVQTAPSLVTRLSWSVISYVTLVAGFSRCGPASDLDSAMEDPLTRRALIAGITGQDGSYLAEHLLELGYEVWGLVRGQANPHVSRLREHVGDVHITTGDLLDQGSLISAVERVQPDEVYNL